MMWRIQTSDAFFEHERFSNLNRACDYVETMEERGFGTWIEAMAVSLETGEEWFRDHRGIWHCPESVGSDK